MYPPLAVKANSSFPPSYSTHWYAGSDFSGSPTTATWILATITTPPTSPKSDEFYYVIASIWDNSGSYDQIGFTDDYGVWGLAYSWTSGLCSSPTYNYSPDAMNLALGSTYTFYISSSATYGGGTGGTWFEAYAGSTEVWSLFASNSATSLEVSNFYCGYFNYTDYEEVWQTDLLNGAPNFNFYFSQSEYQQASWVPATWTDFYGGSPPSPVTVYLSGETVYVSNNGLPMVPPTSVTLLPDSGSTPISASNSYRVTYVSSGANVTTYDTGGTLTVQADPGTYVRFSATTTASTPSEKWAFDSQVPNVAVGAGSIITLYYYDLLSETAYYSISDGGSPPSSSVTYTTAPQTLSTTPTTQAVIESLTASPQAVWALRGTTLTVTDELLGIAGERWSPEISSWIVSQPGQVPTPIQYYHQYQISFGIVVNGGGTGYSAPQVSFSSFGSPATIGPGTNVWADAARYSFPDQLPGSSSSERWEAGPSGNGTVGAPGQIIVSYYNQVPLLLKYQIADGGNPGFPSVTGTYLGNVGSADCIGLSAGNQTPCWLDEGSSYQVSEDLAGSTSTEGWHSGGASGQLNGQTVVALTYFHQYYVDVSYGVIDGGTPTPPFLSIDIEGVPTSYLMTQAPVAMWIDSNTWSAPKALDSSSSTERWAANGGTGGTINSTSPVAPLYFHQFLDTLQFMVVGGGSPIAPVTFTQFGTVGMTAAATDTSVQRWIDAGTTLAYPVELSPSTFTERWEAPSQPKFTASASTTFDPIFHHQFLETLAYSVTGGGSPTTPTFTADQFGSAFSQTLTNSPTGYWFDSGAAWMVSNPLGPSNSLERWETGAITNGTLASSAAQTMRFSYYHQYTLTIGYATIGRGSPSTPTMNSTQLGQVWSSTLSTTQMKYWLDSDTAWNVPLLLSPSTNSERWISNGTLGSTITSDLTERITYQLQYYVMVNAAATGGGTVAPSSNWYDDGSQLSLVASPSTGWALGVWKGNGASAYSGNGTTQLVNIDGAINETAIFYPSLNLVVDSGGLVSYSYGATYGQTSTKVIYVPPGTNVSLTANPSFFYSSNGWTGFSVSSKASVSEVVNTPMTLEAKFGYNIVTVGGVAGVLAAVAVGVVYYVRRHRSSGSTDSGDWKERLGS